MSVNYDFMQKIEPGDVIFSFVNSHIVSIAMATARAVTEPKPDFGGAGLNWQKDGWHVDVVYSDLPNPIRPKEHIEQIASVLDEKYSPLNRSGNGIQAYFFPVGDGLSTKLKKILGNQFENALKILLEEKEEPEFSPNSDDPRAFEEETKIQQRLDIGATQRTQLVIARRGQGIFRTNVRLVEKSCRVTGLAESRHLVASHIKPWRNSSDLEKLDGSNGLLTSQHLRDQVLTKWHVNKAQEVGQFSSAQSSYLEYHRDVVFESTRPISS